MSNPNFPTDWYWRAQDGRVYASKRQVVVTAGDTQYAEWVEAGGVATAWPRDDGGLETDAALLDVLTPYGMVIPGAVIVPASVSRAQAKLALSRAGLLEMVKTAVETDPNPEVKIWFDEAVTWQRTNPHVVALGEGLFDAATVDGLFIAAAQIET